MKTLLESIHKSIPATIWVLAIILPGGLVVAGVFLLVRKYRSAQHKKAQDDHRSEHVLDQ